ncbi:MAG: thiol-disulfide isomerase [Acidobacteria bacterium]|nr:thiol-disulfide isomerase [Acidobacteriota bacterium]
MGATEPKSVTFSKDVLPILQNRCQQCHRPGEAAPMSFLTYKETRPWAKAIKNALLRKTMPPWFADPNHGSFANDRRLSQSEIDTLVAWADSNAREGNPKDAPAPVTYSDGWTIGKPDVIFEMRDEYKIPASGAIDYAYIVIPTNFTEDKWAERIEVRPGNRGVLHHILVQSRAPGVPFMTEAKPGVPFSPTPAKIANGDDTGRGFFFRLGGGVEMVSSYHPGGDASDMRPGQARLIKAGSDLILQMHYTANGKETTDRSRIGIVFARKPPKERVVNTFIGNMMLRIPPNDPNAEVVARLPIYEDVKLQSMSPHMHVRGKAMEVRVTYPDGRKETLLNVPKYDFNWQLTYRLRDPKVLPKGTQFEIVAHYDNSANNRHNPDPSKEVRWGPQTWEEMLAAWIDFAIPAGMDPGLVAHSKKVEATPEP